MSSHNCNRHYRSTGGQRRLRSRSRSSPAPNLWWTAATLCN